MKNNSASFVDGVYVGKSVSKNLLYQLGEKGKQEFYSNYPYTKQKKYRIKSKEEFLKEITPFLGGVYKKCGKSLVLSGARGFTQEFQKLFLSEINKNNESSNLLSHKDLGIITNKPPNKLYICGKGNIEIQNNIELESDKIFMKFLNGLPIEYYKFDIIDWKGNIIYSSTILKELKFFEKLRNKILNLFKIK